MPTTLDAVSDKSQAIYDRLSPAAQQGITTRLQGADRAQEREIKDLLHFPWHKRSGTTEESRADMRTALTAYLAGGGTTDGARELKTLMKRMDPAELSTLANNLCNQSENPSRTLAQSLAPNNSPNPAASAAALTPVLAGLPADPAKAYQVEHAGRNHTVLRNAQGAPQLLSKAELIQSIKHECIQAGAHAAQVNNLDATLERCRSDQLAELASNLQRPDAQVPQIICQMATPFSAHPREDFNAVRGVLESFPQDPVRAGQNIPSGEFITLKRNDQGQIRIENADAALTGIIIPVQNQNLGADKIANVKQTFDNLVANSYGRAGLPLDFMQHVRDARQVNPNASITDALQTYVPNGADIADKMGNSDCLCQTEQLVRELANQGIQAYPAGVWTASLPEQRVNNVKVSPPDAAEKTGRVTHLDVIVPYTDDNGVEKALVLTPGMGTDEKFYKDISLDEVAGPQKLLARARLAPDGTGVDPVTAQKAALGYLSNIQITNGSPGSEGNKQIAGIDLAAGNLYVNTAAGNAYQGPRPEGGNGAIFFNYRDALQNPDAQITLKTPSGEDLTLTKAQALVLMADQIKTQFNMPDDFVQNVLDLTANSQEYSEAVLWESVQNMHGMNQAQNVQVNLAPPQPSVAPSQPSVGADQAIQNANIIPPAPPPPMPDVQPGQQNAQGAPQSLRDALREQKEKLKKTEAVELDPGQTRASLKPATQKETIAAELASLKESKLVTKRV